MKVAIIGSNGLLSNEMQKFCFEHNNVTSIFGIDKPKNNQYTHFFPINLMHRSIDINLLIQNDLIIYAVGAGIQSNLNENYETIYYLNTLLPIKLCKELACHSYKGTFVTFGSYFEIGANDKEYLFDEIEIANSILPVLNDYSISKRLLTKFIVSNNSKYRHLHFILPTIYGPNEASHRLIPYTLSMIDKGEIPLFTAGTQVRQYLYIGDIPMIVYALVKKRQQGIFNIAGKESFSVKKLIEYIYYKKGILMPEGIFGNAKRTDVSMKYLQLSDKKLHKILPDFKFTSLSEVLPMY